MGGASLIHTISTSGYLALASESHYWDTRYLLPTRPLIKNHAILYQTQVSYLDCSGTYHFFLGRNLFGTLFYKSMKVKELIKELRKNFNPDEYIEVWGSLEEDGTGWIRDGEGNEIQIR